MTRSPHCSSNAARVWALGDRPYLPPVAVRFSIDHAPLRQAATFEPACQTARRVFSDAERRDYLLGTRSFEDECAPLTVTLVAQEGVLAYSTSWPLFGSMPRASDAPVTQPMIWSCSDDAFRNLANESPSLPAATVSEELRPDWAALQGCWPDAGRKVWTIVEIDANGHVTEIGPLFGAGAELKRCLTEIAGEWQFPAEPGRQPVCYRLDLDKNLSRRPPGNRGCVWLAIDGHTPSPETITTWDVSLERSLDDELRELAQRNLCPGTHLHVWGEARWRQVAALLARLHRLDRGPISLHFELE